MKHLYATSGMKVVHHDLVKESPDRQTLTKLLLGPSGYLRAPTVRKGKILMVGFEEKMYTDLLN